MPNSTITVQTPSGSGIVFGIDRDSVVVEFDGTYIVNMPLKMVERIE